MMPGRSGLKMRRYSAPVSTFPQRSAKIYDVDRDTVSTWMKKWEKHGEKSLHDQPRSGRPTTLNAIEKELAKQYSKEEPRSLKNVVERLAQKTAKRLSISS